MTESTGNWPSIAQLFSQVILPKVTETNESSGESHIKLGSMFFSVGTWMFENGALLGYGLKDYPVLVTKLLGVPAEHTGEFTQDYLKKIAADLLSVEKVESSTTLADLFLTPTLIRSGYEVTPDAEWIRTEITDQDWIWNFIQVTCQQGVGVGLFFTDTFENCWRNSYQPDVPGSEQYEEAKRSGVLEILQQEDRILENEVKKTLVGALKWIDQLVRIHFTSDERMTIRTLSE